MAGDILTIGPDVLEPIARRCRAVIRSGGVIVYPTDTFYALGADPRNERAVSRLFAIKGRQPDQPILLLLPDAAEVSRWARAVTDHARQLMERFWPGPLTLVFDAREDVLPGLTGGTGKIGLRLPGSPLTRALLQSLGTALTGTSANPSAGPEPRTAADVQRSMGSLVELILDGGAATADRPSTVVDVSGGGTVILRRGAIDEGVLL